MCALARPRTTPAPNPSPCTLAAHFNALVLDDEDVTVAADVPYLTRAKGAGNRKRQIWKVARWPRGLERDQLDEETCKAEPLEGGVEARTLCHKLCMCVCCRP